MAFLSSCPFDKDLTELCSTLTRIAGLPFSEEAMNERKMIISSENSADVLIQTLDSNDARLQCKAAYAIGSICMNQEAGQMLMEKYGIQIITILKSMLLSSNYWSQGDSCFVLGWIVKLKINMRSQVSDCIPIIIQKFKENYIPKRKHILVDQHLLDKQENYRIYALICLINAIQDNPEILVNYATDIQLLIHLLVKLLKQSAHQCQTKRETFREPELLELVPLIGSLLYVMIQKERAVLEQVLQLQALPLLIQVQKKIDTLEPLIQYIVNAYKNTH